MARKLRLEFPGALYHIINRGNYRRWIFDAASMRTAFEACLFEACERSGWLLHGFVIMGNHYHLAVETACWTERRKITSRVESQRLGSS